MSVIAAQMYTLREFTKTPEGIAAALAKVRQIGYEAIQISAFGPCEPAEIARMLTDNGLACASTHLSWQRLSEDLERVIDEHRLWGCAHPAIGSMPHEFRTESGVTDFAVRFNQVGRRLAGAGLDLSYHNHNFEFARTGGKTWLERLYELTDPQYIKAELDTYWITAGGGDPAAWITKYAGRQPILHLKDMVMGPDGQRFAEVGQGNLNWPAILKAARQAGVQWYCVEQDGTYGRDPYDSLKMSLDFLHSMGLR